MTSESFCYWLQGFLEISGAESMTKEQLQVVRDHLELVFHKVTPKAPAAPSQTDLQKLLRESQSPSRKLC